LGGKSLLGGPSHGIVWPRDEIHRSAEQPWRVLRYGWSAGLLRGLLEDWEILRASALA